MPPSPGSASERKRRGPPAGRVARHLIRLTLALANLVPRIDRYVVTGESMVPTLEPGDRLLVLRPALRVRSGNLVLARTAAVPEREIVKRVAAITGTRHRRRFILLGDNTGGSTDSRRLGPLDRSAITGRVLLRYWPDDRRGRLR